MSHSSYSMPALSPSAAAPWRLMDDLHLFRTSQLIQGRILHIVTYYKFFGTCVFLFNSIIEVFFSFPLLFVYCLERYFCTASAQIKQELCKAPGDHVREQGRQSVRTFFFLTGPTSIQIKSFYLPLLCDIVGVNGVRRRDSS